MVERVTLEAVSVVWFDGGRFESKFEKIDQEMEICALIEGDMNFYQM